MITLASDWMEVVDALTLLYYTVYTNLDHPKQHQIYPLLLFMSRYSRGLCKGNLQPRPPWQSPHGQPAFHMRIPKMPSTSPKQTPCQTTSAYLMVPTASPHT